MNNSSGSLMRTALFATISVLLGTVVAFMLLEVPLRFLPVSEGLMAEPVSDNSPVFRFTPNRNVVWSRGWDFAIVNRLHVNNVGYVNDQDYSADDARPLLAVVGDSYVEAPMVPYQETTQGRLASAAAPHARVYSFGASGAPLSQYVIWAREARQRWNAQALVVVVVGNDFDESLAAYKVGPGFHHYIVRPPGWLELQRFDYQPGRLRSVVRHSALARYLVFNLHVLEYLREASSLLRFPGAALANTYVGNTAAAMDPERLRQSEEAVRAFLRDLVAVAGWEPAQILFVVDGLRYPQSDPAIASSYFVRMRGFFIDEARRAGYEAIDLDPHFFSRLERGAVQFEHVSDAHWNGLGHSVAADAVVSSSLFASFARGASSTSRP
jgi:hypothetical protein